MLYVKRKIFSQRRTYTATKEFTSIDEALEYADKYTRTTCTIYRIETSIFDSENLVYTLDTDGNEKDFRQEVKPVHADEQLPTDIIQEKEPPKSIVQKTELPAKEAKSLPCTINDTQRVRDKMSPTKLFTIKHGITYFDSRQVAAIVNKRHDHLIRDIENYIDVISETPKLRAQNLKAISESAKMDPLTAPKLRTLTNANLQASDYFIKSSYKDRKGEKRPCYLISKMGCEFIGNKMTGDKGILFTAMYVKLFNEMETIQKQKQTEYWQQLRAQSKEEHKLLADMIKIFVEYAAAQGSKRANFYYVAFSRLTNSMTATIDRDNTDVKHLHSIIMTMAAIRKAITDGIAKHEPYKQIYITCKNRLKALKDWGALALAG